MGIVRDNKKGKEKLEESKSPNSQAKQGTRANRLKMKTGITNLQTRPPLELLPRRASPEGSKNLQSPPSLRVPKRLGLWKKKDGSKANEGRSVIPFATGLAASESVEPARAKTHGQLGRTQIEKLGPRGKK